MSINSGQVINTFLNPLTFDTWTPKGFHPFGKDNKLANDSVFHAAALLASYGAIGYGSRYIQELFADRSAEKKINKAIEKSTEAQTAVMSPDPDITDREGIDYSQNPFLMKKKADLGEHIMNTSGLFLPALAAYLAFQYGHNKADTHIDQNHIAENEKTIKKLENIYQRANFERLMTAKGYTPEEIKQHTNELLSKKPKMLKPAPEKPAELSEKPSEKPAGSLNSLEKQADPYQQALDMARGESEEDDGPSAITTAEAITLLGLGTLGYGSYRITKDFLDRQDPVKRRADMIKKELDKYMTVKKPTTLVSELDPRVKNLLDRKQPTVKPVNKIKSIPEETSGSLTDMLNTQ